MCSSAGTRCHLKRQCHEIFCFWFFSWISFPPAPEYSIKTVSNFFENSRRYSQLFFNQKNFINFIWPPLRSRGSIYINFCLQVHFQVSAAWYCSNYLPPVSLIPVAICHRRRWQRWQICHWCQQKRGTGGKICRRCRWYRWQICRRCCWPVVHLDLRISLRIFEKILNDPNVIIRGLGEGDSWKKCGYLYVIVYTKNSYMYQRR